MDHIVLLVGGPMDGWLVKPDAPALSADWSNDGRYVMIDRPDEDGTPQAAWVEEEGESAMRDHRMERLTALSCECSRVHVRVTMGGVAQEGVHMEPSMGFAAGECPRNATAEDGICDYCRETD